MTNSLSKLLQGADKITLAVNLSRKKKPRECLEIVKNDAIELGYKITKVLQDIHQLGYYHIYLERGDNK